MDRNIRRLVELVAGYFERKHMLCITRMPEESLRIGDSVVVHVFSVKGQQVRLGIEAPQDQAILRSELYDDSEAMPARRPSRAISALVADDLRSMMRKYIEGTVTHQQLIDSFQAALSR